MVSNSVHAEGISVTISNFNEMVRQNPARLASFFALAVCDTWNHKPSYNCKHLLCN
jgi:hypothetical protein